MEIYLEKIEQARDYIPNLHVVSDCLVRGAQPDKEGLQLLKQAGVLTVVNLCMTQDGLRSFFKRTTEESPEIVEERTTAQALGMNFVQLPLDVFREPPDDTFNRFLDVVQDEAKLPLFVHCLYGRDRTGLIVGFYRIACQGWTVERAYAEMLERGFDSARTNLSDALFAFAKRSQRQV